MKYVGTAAPAVRRPRFIGPQRSKPEGEPALYFSGNLFATKSDTRLAAGGSRFASTAITYPALGQILRSPFIPGAPPP